MIQVDISDAARETLYMLTIKSDGVVVEGSERKGRIGGRNVYDASDTRVGRFEEGEEPKVFDVGGTRIATLEGDYVKTRGGSTIRFDSIEYQVRTESHPDIARVAVHLLLRD